jgi:hypothetical protein
MNAKSFTAFTALILVTGLNQAIAYAPGSQAFSTFNDVLLQPFSPNSGQQIALEQPSPPDRGTPGGSQGGGTYLTHASRSRKAQHFPS